MTANSENEGWIDGEVVTEKTEHTELIHVVNESGLDASKAQVILERFQGYFALAKEWEIKARSLVVTNAGQKAEMKMAREGRLFLREKRIAIEKTRRELKEDALRQGKAIDGLANVLKALIEPIENYLDQQERFVEIAAAKEAARVRVEMERKAEEERVAREKAEAEERERQRQENERLRKEAAEREAQMAAERAESEKKLAAERQKAAAERQAREKAEAEQREADAKATAAMRKAREQAESEKRKADERLAAERAARERAEADKRKADAKAEAERKRAEAERMAREKAEITAAEAQITCPKCGHKFAQDRW